MKTVVALSTPLALLIVGCGNSNAVTEAAVRDQLSDPNSAEFRDIRSAGEVTCGEVNSRNKQGGYDGFKPFLISKEHGTIVRPDGELTPEARRMFGPTLADPGVDGITFDRLFRNICPSSRMAP